MPLLYESNLLQYSLSLYAILTRLGLKPPRSKRPMLGPKSRLMGMSRREGTGFWRGWSRLMMLLARASVASVEFPASGRRLGSAPPGPPPCHGDKPLRPKFFPRSFLAKSVRRWLFWGLRFAMLFIDLHKFNELNLRIYTVAFKWKCYFVSFISYSKTMNYE